jgi:hypothetical protein
LNAPRPLGLVILALAELAGGALTAALAVRNLDVVYAYVSLSGVSLIYFPDFLSYFSILFAVGLAAVAAAYGLWTGKGWGWTLGSYLGVSYMVFFVGFLSYFIAQYGDNYTEFQAGVAYMAVSIAAVFYLDRAHMKARFGRSPDAQDSEAPSPI